MKLFKVNWRRLFFIGGILGSFQFLLLTTLAMFFYPGGTIHHPELTSYDFLYNYFSDLGRTVTFDRTPNMPSYYIFRTALTVGGALLMGYFLALPGLFKNNTARSFIWLAVAFGLLSGACYIGIASKPWNLHYGDHTFYVRSGFISFLIMSIAYSLAILNEPTYPNRYARIMVVFTIVLGIQVVIMLFGPRAYQSNEALFLQATAQKIVVYAEIIVMLIQSVGALKISVRREGLEFT